MKVSYYAVFNYDEHDKNEKEYGIVISFPDIPEAISCARNDKEALIMAKSVLEFVLLDDETKNWIPKENLPKPTALKDIKLKKKEKAVLIEVDTDNVDMSKFTFYV